eukprot:c11545_g1_i2.p1 GENE.c11545_g1_i2~~c11545_g1_i2.p1  ORF type:complete len:253 (-),score=50.83 c11545_g1_i2:2-760(-)
MYCVLLIMRVYCRRPMWSVTAIAIGLIGRIIAEQAVTDIDSRRIAVIFLSALPFAATSLLILILRDCPFMMTCVGASLLYTTVCILDVSASINHFSILSNLCIVAGSLALLTATISKILLPHRFVSHRTWLVNVFVMGLFVALTSALGILYTIVAWHWIVYTLCMLALVLCTIVLQAGMPLVCGLAGIFVMAVRLGSNLPDTVLGTTMKFVIVGMAGALMVVVGIQYNTHKRQIERKVDVALLKMAGMTQLP